MAKVVVIGAHPKGYLYLFHESTRSGKVLRGILSAHGIDAALLNLWDNQEEMDVGIISKEKLSEISSHHRSGHRIAVVGRYMYDRLRKQIGSGVTLNYMPHPSSRSKKYIAELERGLVGLSKD